MVDVLDDDQVNSTQNKIRVYGSIVDINVKRVQNQTISSNVEGDQRGPKKWFH